MSKMNVLQAAVATLLIASCNSSDGTAGSGSSTTDSAAATSETTAVTNGTNEGKDGDYVSLFDGKSLDAWRGYQNKSIASWTVNDGVLHCAGSTEDKSDMRADLITKEQYENFDFSVEWKIAPKGNSGIIYLASEAEKAAYLTGPEYQIADDKGFPTKLENWQQTGANYAMNPAVDPEVKPVGEWNTSRIVVNNGKVEHWLNGKKIVDYEMGSDEWKANKAKGKWKDTPTYGTVKKGHIVLQDHGAEAWFRDIKIKQL